MGITLVNAHLIGTLVPNGPSSTYFKIKCVTYFEERTMLWWYHTTTRTPTNCRELIKFRVRGIVICFVSIRNYDTVTTQIR